MIDIFPQFRNIFSGIRVLINNFPVNEFLHVHANIYPTIIPVLLLGALSFITFIIFRILALMLQQLFNDFFVMRELRPLLIYKRVIINKLFRVRIRDNRQKNPMLIHVYNKPNSGIFFKQIFLFLFSQALEIVFYRNYRI